MKVAKHLGQSVSLVVLMFVVCMGFVGYMAMQAGAL
jgi:hypothetical protein